MVRTVADGGGGIKRGLAALSPEFALVCACLGAAGSDIPDVAVLDAALVTRIARRHQVSGLVAARLVQAGQAVPPELQRRVQLSQQLALTQLAATRELVRELAAARIDAVLLKGLALSVQAYGTPLLRYAADIDVLIAKADVAAAWRVLDKAGYHRITPGAALSGERLALYCLASKDSIHRHPATRVTAELHWRMADELEQPDLPGVGQRAAVELAPGCSVPVLAGPEQFLYLCVHGAAHGWARLKWLADVAALLRADGDGGTGLWQDCVARGGGIAAASAIMLGAELFGQAPPHGFISPRSMRLTLLNALARRAILAGGGTRELENSPWRGWTEMLAKALVAPGWRGRLAVLRRLALSGEDIADLALPPALFWLYPLLRIPLLVRRRLARARAKG